MNDMRYYEAPDILDHTNHNSFIEKIHYIKEIDKVLLYEQNMKVVRIYEATTMQNLPRSEIKCPGVVLALEFCTDKNAIAISLSDRTIVFHDIQSKNYKKIKTLHVPSTQKCLSYIERKKTLFSAGVDGAIFAWNVDKLFSSDLAEMLANQN
jgi:WD40 repeat protein